jgi:hypothetical protein
VTCDNLISKGVLCVNLISKYFLLKTCVYSSKFLASCIHKLEFKFSWSKFSWMETWMQNLYRVYRTNTVLFWNQTNDSCDMVTNWFQLWTLRLLKRHIATMHFCNRMNDSSTLNIFYCSIRNNWIGHTFQNSETSSPIHTWINTKWTYIILYTYFILSEDMKKTKININ